MQLTLDQAARNPDHLAGIRRRSTHRAQRVSIEERFRQFHRANPHIYDLLVQLAREAKARGLSSYGMKAIFERARWHYHIERGDRDFVLNNDFTAYYSRLIELQEPDLEGFFEKRALRSA